MRDLQRRPFAPVPAQAGIGLRAAHHRDVLETRPAVGWFEAHAENYMGGGPAPAVLDRLRRDWPVALHGVGLSLGSAEGLDQTHLGRLAALAERIEPLFVSEHLAWSRIDGTYLNDLLPLPYTAETLDLVCGNVQRMQDRLKRAVLIENASTYLEFATPRIPEGEFLAALARRTGCRVLLDINNLQVNAGNHGVDPLSVMNALPEGAVGELHLAGHHVAGHEDVTILIDDHGSPVSEGVWALYREAIARFPAAATLIEWDTNLPDLSVLVAEASTADRIRADLQEGRHAVAA